MPRRTGVPPRIRVANELRARITADEWAPDESLPPVRELAQAYGVSAGTVAKALRVLASEGLIYVRASYGSFRDGPGRDA